MLHHFPIEFTLESGTHVKVTNAEGNTYEFTLTTTHGLSDNFTYTEDKRSRDEVEEQLDFDQLNALRAFWLKRDEVA
ncbi:MAG: hypothetical protein M3040_16235 [Bacteroidota bacterium]|nr:hypothetical protein [Bacteroidota bacterium]